MVLVAGCSTLDRSVAGTATAPPNSAQLPPVAELWAQRYSAGDVGGALVLTAPGSAARAFTEDTMNTAVNYSMLRLSVEPDAVRTVDGSRLSSFVVDPDGELLTFRRNDVPLEQSWGAGDGNQFGVSSGPVSATVVDYWFFDGNMRIIAELVNEGPVNTLLSIDSYSKDGAGYELGQRDGLGLAGSTTWVQLVVRAAPPGGTLTLLLRGVTLEHLTVTVPAPG